MKRTPLQRYTRLVRTAKAMPARKVGLRRRAMPRGGGLSPARPRRSPEERAARKLLKKRSGGLCEVCPVEHPGTDWHHRVKAGQGGPWSGSNGLLVCRSVHAWITLNPYGARAKGWGLWSTEDPAVEPVRYRGEWVLLGDDGSLVPSDPPVLAAAYDAERRRVELTGAEVGR